ncbi:ATP synthase subunit b, mitochondrial-like [Ostrinia furnacalis]|uniref:ATP synthase subunit b, mitochondrial-like n=1 Tax=Ostrinia furnacalis TaxID=93504 RepID=UPI00103DBCFB|nr:ATP synthase subunit b, mitochondrial-like [Ostrinia furnacalis]
MFAYRFTNFAVHPQLLLPRAIFATHTPLCPTSKTKPPAGKGAVCPGSGGKGGAAVSGGSKGPGLKRQEFSAKVRFGFIPEEWFLFFHSKTGVSGPYVFGIVVANYLLSKEIFIMEHEYYSGLSWVLVLYLVATKMGPGIGASLDKDVDAIVAEFESSRKAETASYETTIKDAKDAQMRAEGQKLLMDAKKENVAMQLEAAYRERFMLVYKTVRGRMDYHVKRYQSEARIHQKWMIGWILENVMKSITPDFEKQALESAIRDLAAAASRAK